MGIREDQLAGIFDRFKQAEGSESKQVAGTGIGLSLVKEIVEHHHGRIDVTSEYGKGSRFRLRFPLAALAAEVPASGNGAPAIGAPSAAGPGANVAGDVLGPSESDIEANNSRVLSRPLLNKPWVLYADDNRDLRDFVSLLLSKEYNLILAPDGRFALDLLKRIPVDLILSDFMMPHMTGSDLLTAVKAEVTLSGIPFVILTAKTDVTDKLNELEKGADDYLSKPFSAEELKARIRNLIQLRAQHLRLKRELAAAREIQQALLAERTIVKGAVRVESLYVPCEELSGDFYDAVIKGHWLYVYLVDVTSHGTVAAQITYLVKGIFQKNIQYSLESEALNQIAWRCIEDYRKLKLQQAMTLMFLRINTENRQCELCFTGTADPVLVRDGKFHLVGQPSDCYIQADQDIRPENFFVSKFTLDHGSHFYGFSDGAYEIKNKDTQAHLRLTVFYRHLVGLPVKGWEDQLLGKIRDFAKTERFADDITVIRLSVQNDPLSEPTVGTPKPRKK